MEIEKIVFENYRQYRDETIAFAYGDKDRRFTIIQGAMGTGKTNLLNAITWCLYGRELHLGIRDRGLPIINTITLSAMKKGETSDVRVELHLRDRDDKKIVISRTLICKKQDDQDYKPEVDLHCDARTGTKLEIKRQEGRDVKIIEGDEAVCLTNNLFPEDISAYFFFDGERLNDYFDKSTSNKLSPYENVIKREVFKISQISLFERVCDHLAKRRDYFASEARGLNPAADEKKDKLDRCEQRIEKIKKDIENKIADKSTAAGLEETYSQELRRYPSSKEVNELQIERDGLESKLGRIRADLDEERSRQLKYLTEMQTIIIGHQAIKSADKLLSDKVESGDIPPDYKKKFIQRLLDLGQCICGADLSKDAEERRKIKLLLKECSDLNEMGAELIDLKHELEYLLEKSATFRETQQSMNKRIRDLEDDDKAANKRLSNIDERISKIDDETIKQLEKDHEAAKRKKEQLIADIAGMRVELENLGRDVQIYTTQYERELKQIKHKKAIANTLLFCNKALEAASSIKENILSEIKTEIEKKTRQQFFELIWKKVNFSDVIIDDEYNFSVLDQKKRESIGTLSAGEKQTLALSFMSALNMESGFDSPIVIDTPLGRISREPKISIAKKLPNFLKGKQVTLLVTEEEYTEEVRKSLSPHIGAEYMIRFKETNEGNDAKVAKYE